MRYSLLFLLIPLFATTCFAQDTVQKKNWITNSVIERFKVLKTDPQTRVGAYKAFYRRRTLVADGYYTKGDKTGMWNFYDNDGKLVEKFDYDKNQFVYEAPLDTDTDVQYRFDAVIDSGARVTRPLRVGGIYYGFIPYINIFRLPFDTQDINLDYFGAFVELLVSPGGRLADYKVHIFSKAYQYDQTFNFSPGLFSEADKQFVPATVNRQPVLARVFIRCAVNTDGTIDFF